MFDLLSVKIDIFAQIYYTITWGSCKVENVPKADKSVAFFLASDYSAVISDFRGAMAM